MRWKCGCSYDGTDYFGWQIQKNGQLTVQEAIENALAELFKERVTITGSGRTDAGVHALEQVFHFDYDWNHGSEKLIRAMRSLLPETIQPLYANLVSCDFHARFSALSKRYEYRLYLGEASPVDTRYCWSVQDTIDINAMKETLPYLIGQHDFAGFAVNRGVKYESTVRTLSQAEIIKDGAVLQIRFQANGFMYKMVRSLVGTLVNIGMGRARPSSVGAILESGSRTPFVLVAPAKGLFLVKPFY